MPARLFKGRFRVLSELARGGMGVTYRAWDEAQDLPVVVKIPKRSLSEQRGFFERFDREVRASASLSHPHIVPVVDFGVDDGEPFLVLRLLPGGSLLSRIPRDPNNKPTAAAAPLLHIFLPDIAAALDHAHAQGLLHRDVKPANIFFDAFNQAFLGDFGLVKLMEEDEDASDEALTATNVAMGTQFYMAPERLIPKGEVDGRADQYSLAITAYEVLAGRRPFLGERDHIVVEQATMPPPLLKELQPDLPDSLCEAIHRALAKRKEKRFDTCAAFAAAALLDVPPPPEDPGFARLLCPKCSRLLRVPVNAAGRPGRCPKCKASMTIGPDLAALWLGNEHATAADDAREITGISIQEPAAQQPPAAPVGRARRFAWPVIGAVAASALSLALAMLWRSSDAPALPQKAAATRAADAIAATLQKDGIDKREDHPEPPAATKPPAEPVQPALPPPQPVAARPDDAIARSPAIDDTPLPTPPRSGKPQATAAAEPEGDVPAVKAPPDQKPSMPVDSPPVPAERLSDTMKWVLVDDPGNAADTMTGLGAVPEAFLIAQYELTNDQYCRFLNESDAGRRNRHGVADGPISPANAARGIAGKRLADGTFRYAVLPGMGDKPVADMRWSDAARVANWLHNDCSQEPDATEQGAYALDHRDLDATQAVGREPDARFWVPSIDEWFKAAFFRFGSKTSAGYWSYPTATNEDPLPVTAPTANGDGNLRGVETTANFGDRAIWPGQPNQARPTTVGTNGAASACGAYDMAGNVSEWTVLDRAGANAAPEATGTARAIACGGDWSSPRSQLDRGWFRDLSTTAIPSATGGVRLACRPAPGLTDRADPTPRFQKKRTFAALKTLQALFPPAPAAALNTFSPQKFDKAIKTPIERVRRADAASLDPEVGQLLAKVAEDASAVHAILQERLTQWNRLATAGMGQRFPQTPEEFLSQFLSDPSLGLRNLQVAMQGQQILETADRSLAPYQQRFEALPSGIQDLRKSLEARYGKQ